MRIAITTNSGSLESEVMPLETCNGILIVETENGAIKETRYLENFDGKGNAAKIVELARGEEVEALVTRGVEPGKLLEIYKEALGDVEEMKKFRIINLKKNLTVKEAIGEVTKVFAKKSFLSKIFSKLFNRDKRL